MLANAVAAQPSLHPSALLAAHLSGHAESLAQQRGIDLKVSVRILAAIPPRLPELLLRALCSVVDNAVEHGFRDRAAGQLSIQIDAPAPEQVSVVIRDDGQGIDWDNIHERCVEQGLDADTPEALRAALLERGVSSRLRMVHMLVLGFGGSFSIDSPPGRGCTVSIVLPERGEFNRW